MLPISAENVCKTLKTLSFDTQKQVSSQRLRKKLKLFVVCLQEVPVTSVTNVELASFNRLVPVAHQ